jgi:DNA-binding beta-propeller fold protein YncE
MLGQANHKDAIRVAGAIRAGRGRRWAIALCAVAAVALWPAAAAHATNRIYWSNFEANTISYANLDGSGGGDLNTAGAIVDGPMGLAIDSAAGRIYWANHGRLEPPNGTSISYANLDGSGGGNFVTSGTIIGPHGLAIDPAAGRIYWANGTSTIDFANLDGSGAGFLDPFPGTVDGPRGLALDPSAGRIYYANWQGNSISYGLLSGSGGADLPTAGATVVNPEGVALDPTSGRLFFSNFSETPADRISYVNLNGTGGGDLNTSGAPVSGPHGVAIDPGAGRIYWPNFDANVISYASLNGGGGGDLPTAGATPNGPDLPVLLEAPAGTGAPAIEGPAKPGSTLHCTRGGWGADLLSSLLYRAPHSFSYEWSENGHVIAGEAPSLPRRSVGNYRCQVTAHNQAGDATQTSGLYPIFKIGRARLNRRKGTARLAVTVAGQGWISLSGKGVRKDRVASEAGASAREPRKVQAGTVKLLVRAKQATQKRLQRRGRARVKVKVAYRPLGGERASQARTVRLKERIRR